MKWYLEVLKKYAVFQGRASRQEYWYFALFNVIILIILVAIDTLIGGDWVSFQPLVKLYSMAILVPSIAVTTRRLHDTGRTGWWQLIYVVPLIGLIVLIIFMVQDSEPGPNYFGLNPKGVAE